MDAVIRATAIYFILLVLMRLMGKRSLGQITNFDFILLIIIGQAIQYGLVGTNYSVTHAYVLAATLGGLHLLMTRISHRFEKVARWVNGAPLIVVEHGKLLEHRAHKAGVTKEDVLESARQSQGLSRMDQIKYAVIERSGTISVIPW